eukprot:10411124-Alexandrium_andersonii.AAC.1
MGMGIWACGVGEGFDLAPGGSDFVHRSEVQGGIEFWTHALGPMPSSTRAEVVALLLALFAPCPLKVAVDNANAVRTANRILRRECFRRPWGLMRDGDLWQAVQDTVHRRGTQTVVVVKTKGHATQDDLDRGLVSPHDKRGNEHADILAARGRREACDHEALVAWLGACMK